MTWQTENDEAKYDWIGAVLKAKRYAKLGKCSLKAWQQYLKPGIAAALLRAQAMKLSDTEAAKLMQKAKLGILQRVRLSGVVSHVGPVAQGSPLLTGEGGSNAAPVPSRLHPWLEEINQRGGTILRLQSILLQAHPALESNGDFRLTPRWK